jgi:hypothetical protein
VRGPSADAPALRGWAGSSSEEATGILPPMFEGATSANISVSLATVYNTLNQLTDVGLLRQVSVDGSKTYFDTNVTAHHISILKIVTNWSTYSTLIWL